MLKSVLFVVAVVTFLNFSADAKCGNGAISVDGVIVGPASGARVVLKVSPDPNWEPQPQASIATDGKFTAIVYFDRTQSEGNTRDNCSRQPKEVSVELQRGAQVVDRISLIVRRDFARTNKHDYRL